ncbi:MAG: alcohol dehydrogenase catalytic domain-containing protein [Dethiobacteria bacterium]|nr:alcohol dehydrogenase catalytic domain-containing protein [Bacillota bacterium]
MLQAIMQSPGKIEFREVPLPEIGSGEVLIRTSYIGICGSDIHVYHGQHPYTSYPVVQGHEVSGEVVKVGDNVHKFKAGDKVTIMPQVFCGKCYPCRTGSYHICDGLKVLGFQTEGVAAEYFKISQEMVLPLPEEVDLLEGAMVEPLAVAVHALGRGGLSEYGKILVLGAGTIGNLTAQVAKAMGGQVMITDLSDYRLELAKQCGADHCVNTSRESLEQAIADKFGPDKADLILECVGSETTIGQAISNARKGSKIIVVGVYSRPVAVDLGFVQDRELQLIGSLMYREDDFRKAIELLGQKKVQLKPLISKVFSFKEFAQAYEYIDQNREKALKVMVQVN